MWLYIYCADYTVLQSSINMLSLYHACSFSWFHFFFFWLCVQDWDQCEKGISASHEKLRDFKQKLSVPLPDHHEELHTEQICCKVHKQNLTHLVSYDLLDAYCFSNIWRSFLLFELKHWTLFPDQICSDKATISQ